MRARRLPSRRSCAPRFGGPACRLPQSARVSWDAWGWLVLLAGCAPTLLHMLLEAIAAAVVQALVESDHVSWPAAAAAFPCSPPRPPPEGRRRGHRQGLRLLRPGPAAQRRLPHHPHRRGEGGHQLRQAGSEVAGSPDAGGGPAVRGRRPVRPRLHAAQGPGCREVRRVQARPHSLITLLEKAKDGIAGKTGTAVSM